MAKLIVLKLDGDFQQGFRATLEIGLEGDRPETEIIGKLPPAVELVEYYKNWRSIYHHLGKTTRIIKPKTAKVENSQKKRREECRILAKELSDRLNTWLKSESFLPIREKWLEKVNISDEVRVIIRAENYQLWRLPWQQWDLLERYHFAEVALSNLEYEQPVKAEITSSQNLLRILAILGNSKGIEIEEDRKQLENLPGAVTTLLIEPQRQELNDQLWQHNWHILFFAGHSQTEGESGRIYLNQTDSLTLDELKYALKKTIANGLQLAIFNSCDGLGLARELEPLHIPQIIVMREPVPDKVAQTFLQYFLQAFSRGKSLYLSVLEARQRLQGLENEFPCASWLPVIYQNPAVIPLNWPKLSAPATEICQKLSFGHRWQKVLGISLVVTGLVMGMRSLGILQKWELETYDRLLRQRPSETADSRLLLVGVNEEDLRQYNHPLPDNVLVQLIEKLEQHQPLAIGLDIYRDRPVPPGHKALISQFQQNQSLVTVCFGTDKKQAVAPPPESPIKQIGFNDLENDFDYTIRRHLLSRTPNPISPLLPCQTPYSFSLQLAYRYLKAKGISVKVFNKNWQFDNIIFKRLEPRTGGYQNLDARGNQILINYRASSQIAQTASIKEILTGQFNPNWIKNRVVLIGVIAPSIQDYHNTPYGRMRGLEIHAHIVSQIISAVVDKRPLIWSLPQWCDAFWVWVWSLTGGIIVWKLHSQIKLILVFSASGIILYGLCWVFLLNGGWLPLIPAALALVVTGGVSLFWRNSSCNLR